MRGCHVMVRWCGIGELVVVFNVSSLDAGRMCTDGLIMQASFRLWSFAANG